jgi:AcrR family transcriptional regulator
MPVPRAGLSPAALVELALAVVDSDGPAGLTLTAVAGRAGVATPALYKHVRNLAELHQLVTVRVLAELTDRLTDAALGRSGDEAVRALARAFRSYVTDHPGRYAVIVAAPRAESAAGAAADRMLDVFLAVLRGYDLHGADAIHAARALRSACHGFAVLQTAGGFGLPQSLDVSFELMITMLIHGLPLAAGVDARPVSGAPD